MDFKLTTVACGNFSVAYVSERGKAFLEDHYGPAAFSFEINAAGLGMFVRATSVAGLSIDGGK